MRMDPTRRAQRRRRRERYAEAELARVLRDLRRRALRRPHRPGHRGRPPGRAPPASWPSSCATPSPPPARRTGGHPAKRTFQAIRIEVNDELDVLPVRPRRRHRRARPGRSHRRAVLPLGRGPHREGSVLREAETGGCTCPPGLPCACGAVPDGPPAAPRRRGRPRPPRSRPTPAPRAPGSARPRSSPSSRWPMSPRTAAARADAEADRRRHGVLGALAAALPDRAGAAASRPPRPPGRRAGGPRRRGLAGRHRRRRPALRSPCSPSSGAQTLIVQQQRHLDDVNGRITARRGARPSASRSTWPSCRARSASCRRPGTASAWSRRRRPSTCSPRPTTTPAPPRCPSPRRTTVGRRPPRRRPRRRPAPRRRRRPRPRREVAPLEATTPTAQGDDADHRRQGDDRHGDGPVTPPGPGAPRSTARGPTPPGTPRSSTIAAAPSRRPTGRPVPPAPPGRAAPLGGPGRDARAPAGHAVRSRDGPRPLVARERSTRAARAGPVGPRATVPPIAPGPPVGERVGRAVAHAGGRSTRPGPAAAWSSSAAAPPAPAATPSRRPPQAPAGRPRRAGHASSPCSPRRSSTSRSSRPDRYLSFGEAQRTDTQVLAAERGAILDRNGDELAVSRPTGRSSSTRP